MISINLSRVNPRYLISLLRISSPSLLISVTLITKSFSSSVISIDGLISTVTVEAITGVDGPDENTKATMIARMKTVAREYEKLLNEK